MTDEDLVRKFKSLYCGVCYFQVCSECRYKSPFMKGYRCAEKDLLPVWHNLRENPKDFPKNSDDEKLYLVYWGENDYGVVQFNDGRWWSFDSGWYDVKEVIAWCEMPMFEEVESC